MYIWSVLLDLTLVILYHCANATVISLWKQPESHSFAAAPQIFENTLKSSGAYSSYLCICQTQRLVKRSFTCILTLPLTHKVWTSSSRHFSVNNNAKSDVWRETKSTVSEQTHMHVQASTQTVWRSRHGNWLSFLLSLKLFNIYASTFFCLWRVGMWIYPLCGFTSHLSPYWNNNIRVITISYYQEATCMSVDLTSPVATIQLPDNLTWTTKSLHRQTAVYFNKFLCHYRLFSTASEPISCCEWTSLYNYTLSDILDKSFLCRCFTGACFCLFSLRGKNLDTSSTETPCCHRRLLSLVNLVCL